MHRPYNVLNYYILNMDRNNFLNFIFFIIIFDKNYRLIHIINHNLDNIINFDYTYIYYNLKKTYNKSRIY